MIANLNSTRTPGRRSDRIHRTASNLDRDRQGRTEPGEPRARSSPSGVHVTTTYRAPGIRTLCQRTFEVRALDHEHKRDEAEGVAEVEQSVYLWQICTYLIYQSATAAVTDAPGATCSECSPLGELPADLDIANSLSSTP